METEAEAGEIKKKSPLDEVDFTSGYDKQYNEEYRPLRPVKVVPPDPKKAWYRNLDTVLMVIFLMAIFICGSWTLIIKVFPGSVLTMLIIFGIYIVVALFLIWFEVKTIHFR